PRGRKSGMQRRQSWRTGLDERHRARPARTDAKPAQRDVGPDTTHRRRAARPPYGGRLRIVFPAAWFQAAWFQAARAAVGTSWKLGAAPARLRLVGLPW